MTHRFLILTAVFCLTSTFTLCPANAQETPEPVKRTNTEIIVNLVTGNLEVPDTHIIDKDFWIDTFKTGSVFNLYTASQQIEGEAEIVANSLRQAFNNSTDTASARQQIRELLTPRGGGDPDIPGSDTLLFERITAVPEHAALPEGAAAWVRLITLWNNETATHHKNQYREALGEAIDVVTSLGAAILKTHEAAAGNAPSGGGGVASGTSTGRHSWRIRWYEWNRDRRKARNQWIRDRRQARSRFTRGSRSE